jgi:glycerol-3-phosphate dehydrogenase
VNRLVDILLRRTEMAMAGHVSLPLIHEVAEIAASELAWDAERKRAEIESTIQAMQRRSVRMAA